MNTDDKSQVPNQPEFSKLRAMIWPIHSHELKKFLAMGLMMLCILFIYTLLRDLKDTLMVSKAVGGGAETLSFLKLYGVTPSAVIFTIIFVKLANIFEREKLFYVIVLFFLSFFALFGFVMYPLKETLHMSAETIASLQQSWPHLYWLWPVLGNWSFSLFSILSGLWGSVVLSALFWQFANEITKVIEAKRFYSLFGFIGNFGLLASGSVIIFCAKLAKASANVGLSDTFATNLRYQIGAVIFFGITLICIYRWINKSVLTDPKYYNPDEVGPKKKKPKMGLAESAKMIFTSPYLMLIAALVLAYGISINLIEDLWKGQIKMLYPDSNDYNALMGKLSLTTGAITIVVMLVGSNILRLLSWRTSALITPVFLLVAGCIFFGVIIYENIYGHDAMIMGQGVLYIAVITGLVQNAFTKGVKYSLFDSTMQMAYIPLGQEQKVKGQAAVSVLVEQCSRSGGAFIQSTLLMAAGGEASLAGLVNILGSIVFVVVMMWIFSVINLSTRFEKLTSEKVKKSENNSSNSETRQESSENK